MPQSAGGGRCASASQAVSTSRQAPSPNNNTKSGAFGKVTYSVGNLNSSCIQVVQAQTVYEIKECRRQLHGRLFKSGVPSTAPLMTLRKRRRRAPIWPVQETYQNVVVANEKRPKGSGVASFRCSIGKPERTNFPCRYACFTYSKVRSSSHLAGCGPQGAHRQLQSDTLEHRLATQPGRRRCRYRYCSS